MKLRFLGIGANHNLSIRQTSGFPAFAPRATVRGWPGQMVNHQIVFTGATVSNYSAMGLPAGLTHSSPDRGDQRYGERCRRAPLRPSDGRDEQGACQPGAVVQYRGWKPADRHQSIRAADFPDGARAGRDGAGNARVPWIPIQATLFHFNAEVVSGSINPHCLSVVGGQLMVTNSSGLDFENGLGGVLVVRVAATDLGHNSYLETFSIQLIDERTEDGDGDGVSQAMEEDVFNSSDQEKDDYITLDTDGDGIPALTEYAFGLNPRVSDAGKHLGAPGSTAGLPGMQTFEDAQGRQRLRLEFLRRTGSGMTYVPQFSSNLKTWTPPAQAVQVTWTNGVWERCMIEDYQFTPSPAARFGRVMLQFVPPVSTDTSAPTAIDLASATLMENSPPGTVVGILSTVDPDPEDTHTYSVSVISGATPGILVISGNQLVTAPGSSFDYESSTGSVTIQVRTTDSTLKYF